MTIHPSPTLFLVPPHDSGELAWQPIPGAVGVDNKVLYDAGSTVAGVLRLHPGGKELSHFHVHGEHHLYVLAGAVIIDDTELSSGSYMHIPARLRHKVHDAGQGSLLFYVFTPADD